MPPSPAQEARAVVGAANHAALATAGPDGHPWASLVAYATLADGSPVLCVSTLAEHGRNLAADERASLLVTACPGGTDPLDAARVTLAGRAVRPPDATAASAARDAYLAAVPEAAEYVDFADFALYVLHVERVRWVGGYGSMRSVTPDDYAAAAR